ncbi:glycosyltransferase family 2 protein [Mucilaginibacter gilvus]|uniref:Glycosyltransferase family 2 protein n=1 Tax=Mucilaginibacter gilvus TaxID=2305909 RepID=A0A3S4Y5T3_9SPHI|nr:glycosyltransferase family 2 protein [Mucilaginibacter gilvus]RWY48079.1 glycosyltransferase family 2 protein [Mucilaginibacter gilvus]
MVKPLLTIAIPTYNRAQLLGQCLDALLAQLSDEIAPRIEFIVYDNCSADNTTAVVEKYIAGGHKIAYFKNAENIGADGNIAACFTKASGKYVWVFSDDDFLLPGYLKFIINLLDKEDWGSLYMNTQWYSGEYKAVNSPPTAISLDRFTDPLKYIERVSYWTTFITGNIINKSLFTDTAYIPEFFESNLVQLSWTLPAAFKGLQNGIINDRILACRADNTGGYKLLKVFGANFNDVMDRLITKGVIDKRVKRIMNHHLLSTFFPMFINNPRANFEKENPFKIMVPVFWNYRSFWLKIFPALFKNQYLKHVSAQ